MSYILDALRKSEEERQKSRTRPAGAGHTFVKDAPPPKMKFAFGLILTGCMLLAALILGTGWWWSQNSAPEPALPNSQVKPNETEEETYTEKSPGPSSVPSPEEVSTSDDDSGAPAGPTSQPATKIPLFSDMGADFQARVMELNFSGHVYSPEPGLRTIMINDAVAREGDPIGPDLALDEITEDGVIISLNQTKFQIKLF